MFESDSMMRSRRRNTMPGSTTGKYKARGSYVVSNTPIVFGSSKVRGPRARGEHLVVQGQS